MIIIKTFEELKSKVKEMQGEETSVQYMLGEQLLEIVSGNELAQEIVLQDLEVPEMSLAALAKELQKYADEMHRKVKCNAVCISPLIAEDIIKKFYKIENLEENAPAEKEEAKPSGHIDLEDFF